MFTSQNVVGWVKHVYSQIDHLRSRAEHAVKSLLVSWKCWQLEAVGSGQHESRVGMKPRETSQCVPWLATFRC